MSAQNEGFHDDVEWMVGAALKKVPKPYGPEIIEDVFVMIEESPNLMKNYTQLLVNHDVATVNQRVGHFTRVLTGYQTGKSATATRSSLVKTYTLLVPSKA